MYIRVPRKTNEKGTMQMRVILPERDALYLISILQGFAEKSNNLPFSCYNYKENKTG
jgi:hypothetical protein